MSRSLNFIETLIDAHSKGQSSDELRSFLDEHLSIADDHLTLEYKDENRTDGNRSQIRLYGDRIEIGFGNLFSEAKIEIQNNQIWFVVSDRDIRIALTDLAKVVQMILRSN